jgi:hypothetical protein
MADRYPNAQSRFISLTSQNLDSSCRPRLSPHQSIGVAHVPSTDFAWLSAVEGVLHLADCWSTAPGLNEEPIERDICSRPIAPLASFSAAPRTSSFRSQRSVSLLTQRSHSVLPLLGSGNPIVTVIAHLRVLTPNPWRTVFPRCL